MENDAADILAEMADTFRERNKIYGDNYKTVGNVMLALFPDGMSHKTDHDYNIWHLMELAVVKLTRLANSKMTHKDSVHDAAVYLAMLESMMEEK